MRHIIPALLLTACAPAHAGGYVAPITDAPVYGAGIDVALSRRLLGGLLATRSDDAERIEARIGWRW